MYLEGQQVPKDYGKAQHYFEQAAKQGDKRAMYYLGQIHQRGLGKQRDLAKAASWYKQSAELGFNKSQNEYGMLLAQGQGVKLDYVKAYAWLSLAEKNGNNKATANKNRLSQILKPEQLSQAKAAAKAMLNES